MALGAFLADQKSYNNLFDRRMLNRYTGFCMKADCGEIHPLDQGLDVSKPVFLMARQARREAKNG